MVVRNQELPTIRTQQPKTSEEEIFLGVIKAKKVKELPETELRKALKYAMLKVGLRGKNFPTGVTKSLLLDHIFINYGNHTPDEIRLAFNLAAAGKLSLPIEEVNCYENFSCLYFSKIMNAYRVWAEQVYQQNEPSVNQIEYKPDPAEIDKEFESFKNNPDNKRFFPNDSNK